jgi:predicted RNase H-like HicB family nuclease
MGDPKNASTGVAISGSFAPVHVAEPSAQEYPLHHQSGISSMTRWNAAASTLGDLMKYSIECEREEDGRWLAEVPELPGVMAYGSTAEEAQAKAQVLALRVLAERLEHGEARPVDISISVATV